MRKGFEKIRSRMCDMLGDYGKDNRFMQNEMQSRVSHRVYK